MLRRGQGLEGYKTAFVYAMLEGPPITLEFAEISGITGGFGYNSGVHFPIAQDIPQCPLISVLPPQGPGPQGALSTLVSMPWFAPQNGSFWVAAGLTCTAFEMLEVSAVVVIEWDPSVKLGLLGIATADISADGGFTFAHMQLGIAETADMAAVAMKIDGRLMPSSYILDPTCHLTGGFALYNWLSAQDPTLRGDWVFTIGGYHRQFTPSRAVP